MDSLVLLLMLLRLSPFTFLSAVNLSHVCLTFFLTFCLFVWSSKLLASVSLNISLLELLHTLGFIVQEVLSRDNTLDHPLVWVVFFNPRWCKVLVSSLILSIQRDCLGERSVFSHYGETPLQVLELIQFAGSQLGETCIRSWSVFLPPSNPCSSSLLR